MKVYLVCFDIENDKKRRRLSKLLLSYGERVQYSVFEITLKSDASLKTLTKQCKRHVEQGDSLRFYALPFNARQASFDIDGEPIARFPQAEIL
ncbi:CRISPR-associated endonuclease Cas2 [Vibrio sinaloensis]|uniref:CRISPR-associated endoribonuclease Cas2 n=1 Tax=Photobacterium sp. (strain ATCC 43367) TaxID=379097 RepID=A0A0A5I1E5_PHOS4|nr:CRISPR-associated endonuclease Cas2 [Vibrio sinaloensis]KGY10360.1 CRISPR-associated protein Cas2 [Vibrio sinaloensis]